MAMSIDEAIQHCEERALCLENGECGEEHRQLAEWLRELKRLRAESVRHGEWLFEWDSERDPKRLFVRIVCSMCGLKTGTRANFFPNCGGEDGWRG